MIQKVYTSVDRKFFVATSILTEMEDIQKENKLIL